MMRCEIQEDLIAFVMFVISFPLVLLCSLAFPCSLFFSAFMCAFIIIINNHNTHQVKMYNN